MTGALDLLGEDYREALAHGYAELELAERFGDEPRAVTALRGIARNEQRLTGRMPVDMIERALEREWVVRDVREVAGWPTFCLADMLSWTDDLEGGLAKWDWLLGEAAARGETHSLIDILSRTVICECALGRFDRAMAHAEEGCLLTSDSGAPVFEAILVAERALVRAHLGDVEAARRDAAVAIELASTGNPQADRIAAWALGILELSLDDPAAAHEQLGPLVASRRAAGVAEPGDMRFVTDEVEALIGIGHLDEAEALLGWYEGLAEASGRIGALAACARCRGLLLVARGDVDAAVDALGRSVELYRGVTEPLGLARTLLVLGSHRASAAAQAGRPRDARCGAGAVRSARCAALGSSRPGRARPDRRPRGIPRRPHADRGARRRPGRGGANQSRGRHDPRRVRADRRGSSVADLRQGRRAVPGGARPPTDGRRRSPRHSQGSVGASSGGTCVSGLVDPRLRSWHAAHRAASATTAGRNLRCLQDRSSPSTGVFASRSSRSCSRRRS